VQNTQVQWNTPALASGKSICLLLPHRNPEKRLSLKKHIPNFITTLNLFSGCTGIILTLLYQPDYGAYFIALSALFDFLDGMAARLLHVKSEIGKELDSLADVVSFGVLPGIMLFVMMAGSDTNPAAGQAFSYPALLAMIVPVLSAVRLAKFNLDTRQTNSFIGLPVPANALFLGSLPLIAMQAAGSESSAWLLPVVGNFYFLAVLSIGMSLLLVSEIPLMSLKFANLRFSENKPRFILIGFALLAFLLLGYAAIPLIILAYIGLSLIFKPS
jgi:CDP-diacylglycerol---serine O-phosphatidyltransferase